MLYSQSGLSQFLTVGTLDLYYVSVAYLVPGVGSPVLAGERNTLPTSTAVQSGVGSPVLAGERNIATAMSANVAV